MTKLIVYNDLTHGQVESLELYIDADKSGKDENSPQLQPLNQDIAARKTDRMTRSHKNFVDCWGLFDSDICKISRDSRREGQDSPKDDQELRL